MDNIRLISSLIFVFGGFVFAGVIVYKTIKDKYLYNEIFQLQKEHMKTIFKEADELSKSRDAKFETRLKKLEDKLNK